MFPICNESGRVIAFTARTLETGEKAGPKYINSPETPLYSKGQVLFNLDKAKLAIRKSSMPCWWRARWTASACFWRNSERDSDQWYRLYGAAGSNPRRHTSNVFVNFDPDAAGANAAEKSIALLTEEGFAIKIVVLDGGLDPDRFVRDRGVEAYKNALRSSSRQSDYLIERARQLFPGASAEQKVKAMNFLLPHIRRIPERLARDQFAADAAQKMGIDSAVLREELRQAALKRRDRVESRAAALTEVERVLLRALAITVPEYEPSRRAATQAIQNQPAYFEHLGSFSAMQAMLGRGAADPMDAVADPGQKALLAEALLHETVPPEEREVLSAVQEVQERWIESRQRALRAQIAEAERRGDFAEVALLSKEKMDLDRALRALQRHLEPGS